MENPLLTESPCRWGAPQFDRIRVEHYLPAFETGIAEAKAEIDAIVSNPEAPDFHNTVKRFDAFQVALKRDLKNRAASCQPEKI